MRALPSPVALFVTLLTLASCVAPREAERAAPAPGPATPSTTPAMPPPVQRSVDWDDWPFTPGGWTYRENPRGSIAMFGPAGGDALLILRCDRTNGQVSLARAGRTAATAEMLVRAGEQSWRWPAEAGPGPGTGNVPFTTATRSAGDPGLDGIAYARGRFSIELPGMAALVLRPWAEVARVIEDCRGG